MTTASTIRIAAYAPEHHDAVAALVLGIQQDEFGASVTYEGQPDLVDPAGFFGAHGGAFWVALAPDTNGGADGETVIGTVGTLDFGEGRAALRKMFVRADWRGPTYRVAQRLLDAAVDWARANHVTAIYLDTIDAFRAAHRFYAKNGFDEVAKAAMPSDFPAMAGGSRFFIRKL